MPAALGIDIHEVTLAEVREFLGGAEPEPLIWEAKGTDLTAHEVRRQCGGFANSRDGGLLILGASTEKDSGAWRLDGVEFPDREPHRWVSSCLTDGVRPRPRIDVRSFNLDNGRHVALVDVDPLAAGPCIVRGTVYERIPGQTVPVRDPARLAELYQRGRDAHTSARTACEDAVDHAHVPFTKLPRSSSWGYDRYGPDEPDRTFSVVLGLARVGVPTDIHRRLFTEPFRELVGRKIEQLAAVDGALYSPSVAPGVLQDRRMARAYADREYLPDWALTATWGGAVSVAYLATEVITYVDQVLTKALQPALGAAEALLEGLDIAGDGYVTVEVRDFTGVSPWPEGVRVRAPVTAGAEVDLDYIGRSLSRSLGIDVLEP